MSMWFTAHSCCTVTLPTHSLGPCKHVTGYSFTNSFSQCNMSGTRCIRRSGDTYLLTKERLMSMMSHVSLSAPSRTASHSSASGQRLIMLSMMGMQVLLSGTVVVVIGDCPANAVGGMLTTAVEM